MEITSNLRNILNLLNATIIKRDNIFYVYDNLTDTMQRIIRNDKQFSFDIARENGTYHIVYGYKGIRINKDDEHIIFDLDGITYAEKNDKSRYNSTYALINSNVVNFYEKEDLDNGYIEDGIKLYSDFSHMKISHTKYIDEITEKEDITTKDEDDDNFYLHHIIRKYDVSGALITGTLYDEKIETPIEIYAYDELANNKTFDSVFNKIENFIPGIGYYCAKENDIVNSIVTGSQKAIK